jgi:hypothetical protein
VFYQAAQIATLFTYSTLTWKLGWTFAPANVSFYRMLATNYQPAFQKDSALVENELAAARRELRDAEIEAEALGLKSHRGLNLADSLKKIISSQRRISGSPASSRGNSVKGGAKAGASLGVANLFAEKNAKQPRAREAPRWPRRRA